MSLPEVRAIVGPSKRTRVVLSSSSESASSCESVNMPLSVNNADPYGETPTRTTSTVRRSARHLNDGRAHSLAGSILIPNIFSSVNAGCFIDTAACCGVNLSCFYVDSIVHLEIKRASSSS